MLMTDNLRDRIAAALLGDHCVQGMTEPCDDCRAHALRQANAVIKEITPQFLDFGGWMVEEVTGETMTTVDLVSCWEEWLEIATSASENHNVSESQQGGEMTDSGDAQCPTPDHPEGASGAPAATGASSTRPTADSAGTARTTGSAPAGSTEVSDDLRDRIATAMRIVDDMRVCKLSDADIKFMVDAVIRELGLTREWSIGDDEGGRVLWTGDEEPVDPRPGEIVEVRYISDWIPEKS